MSTATTVPSITTASSITTARNFLTKAERQSGGIATWALIAAGVFMAYLAQDTILGVLNFGIAAVGKAITLGVLGLVGWMFFMWITNPATAVELRHLNYRWCRKVSTFMMKQDPFGRMRAFANEYLQEQWEKFNTAAVAVQQQLQETKAKLEKSREALANHETEAATLQSRYCQGNTWASEEHRNGFRMASQRAQFEREAITKREAREKRLAIMIKVLDRMRETFRYQIDMTRLTADFLEEQYREAKAADDATSAAASAFSQGDMAAADKEVREYIETLTAEHIARAEVVMKQIPQLTAVGDLKGDIAEDEMLRRLQALDVDSQEALVAVESTHRQLTSGNSATVVEAIKVPEAVPVKKYLKRSA